MKTLTEKIKWVEVHAEHEEFEPNIYEQNDVWECYCGDGMTPSEFLEVYHDEGITDIEEMVWDHVLNLSSPQYGYENGFSGRNVHAKMVWVANRLIHLLEEYQ